MITSVINVTGDFLITPMLQETQRSNAAVEYAQYAAATSAREIVTFELAMRVNYIRMTTIARPISRRHRENPIASRRGERDSISRDRAIRVNKSAWFRKAPPP